MAGAALQGGRTGFLAMGKRSSRSQSQLLSTLTKKQKKHLRDFGEEHPFYDRYGGASVFPGAGGGVGSRSPGWAAGLPGVARGSSRFSPRLPGARVLGVRPTIGVLGVRPAGPALGGCWRPPAGEGSPSLLLSP